MYVGRLFIRSAHSPLRDAHRAANHSSVRRPSRRAPVAHASPNSISAYFLDVRAPGAGEPATQPEAGHHSVLPRFGLPRARPHQ